MDEENTFAEEQTYYRSPCDYYGHEFEDSDDRPGVRVCRHCNEDYEE